MAPSLPLIALVLCLWQTLTLPALAYIDPGTGSMLWQVLLSAMLGMGYAFRTLFRRKPAAKANDSDQE
jgi:hypothetical protein